MDRTYVISTKTNGRYNHRLINEEAKRLTLIDNIEKKHEEILDKYERNNIKNVETMIEFE